MVPVHPRYRAKLVTDAVEVVRLFWERQNNGQYDQLVDLFSDDAVLEDPIFGRFVGANAILGFMQKMVKEMKDVETRFEVVQIGGGENAAWAQWHAISPKGIRQGVGIYKVEAGKLTYYRDYMDSST